MRCVPVMRTKTPSRRSTSLSAMPPPEHFMNQSQSANLPRLTTGAAKHPGKPLTKTSSPPLTMTTMAQIATSILPAVLAISGSDSSGGAGMQADLKTMLACGVFGMSAITALTAQNTTGVRSIQDTKPDILADQINMVFEDIPPVAVKIGMVSATDIIDVIAERLTFHHATNIVLDPV
ncbi:hydroxymethylpyrimidine/phosphomethylpyrimidine kinase, partial [Escherichia coli]|nr:hydroxymethylpyrimidine/phosphomethylpyrimidine kinase [Escherichia coli]